VTIESVRQLGNARKKLRMLQDRFGVLDAEPVADRRTRELTSRSLKKLVNQLKEEIARFESHASARSDGT
jgi:hypothetical protein